MTHYIHVTNPFALLLGGVVPHTLDLLQDGLGAAEERSVSQKEVTVIEVIHSFLQEVVQQFLWGCLTSNQA